MLLYFPSFWFARAACCACQREGKLCQNDISEEHHQRTSCFEHPSQLLMLMSLIWTLLNGLRILVPHQQKKNGAESLFWNQQKMLREWWRCWRAHQTTCCFETWFEKLSTGNPDFLRRLCSKISFPRSEKSHSLQNCKRFFLHTNVNWKNSLDTSIQDELLLLRLWFKTKLKCIWNHVSRCIRNAQIKCSWNAFGFNCSSSNIIKFALLSSLSHSPRWSPSSPLTSASSSWSPPSSSSSSSSSSLTWSILVQVIWSGLHCRGIMMWGNGQ